MSYLTRLSGRQRLWLAATLVAMIAMLGVGWILEPKGDQFAASPFTTNRTIRQIASQIDTTGFALAKELGLPRSVDKDTPLVELGVGQGQLDEVTTHLLSHRGRGFKYYVFAALSLFGLVWLVRLGRPDGSPDSERKTWYPRCALHHGTDPRCGHLRLRSGQIPESDGRGGEAIQGHGGIAAFHGGRCARLRLLHLAGYRRQQARVRMGVSLRAHCKNSCSVCPSSSV